MLEVLPEQAVLAVLEQADPELELEQAPDLLQVLALELLLSLK